jgi:hypothetical protein
VDVRSVTLIATWKHGIQDRWPYGRKAHGIGEKDTKSNRSLTDMKGDAQFAVCISNKGYAASLEVRKIYRLIPDKAGAKHGLVRVVDEMGEDYLFPEEYFVSLRLPQAAERAVLRVTLAGRRPPFTASAAV